MNASDDEAARISTDLRKVLNTHGHGFHYAVVRRGEELYDLRETKWLLEGTEVPIVAGDATSHVDFVLGTRTDRIYLVGECKRADPARARWCFARTPYRWRNERDEELIFEQLVLHGDGTRHTRPHFSYMTGGSYQLCFELKTGHKGDGEARAGKSIEEAVSQVLRGVSGLIELVTDFARSSGEGEKTIKFLPAIFTTAELWATECDLAGAELATGNLGPEQVRAEPIDWVWFTHNRSPRLGPSAPFEGRRNDLPTLVRHEYARSIAVISVNGIDDFLKRDLEEWLED
jgi:hypothetical protein